MSGAFAERIWRHAQQRFVTAVALGQALGQIAPSLQFAVFGFEFFDAGG
ncbi:MAG: hypothetical protein IPG56_09845 [Caulobacteraceae bacterium]|nr:hypothetical protein [Caulobacteraceae bacterium]